MVQNSVLTQLPGALLPWYEKNKRQLPWRMDREPYHIWISEIMLQQTRVEAVKGYYARFLSVLPTVEALAKADDDLLHKLWEGLGYYNRVRNMKKAAQVILAAYDGIFPREYADILALPGIGEYTAGAICSIAYDQPVPAVDGNVLRVVSRILCDDTPVEAPAFKKLVRQALSQIYPREAGAFTQALMELGATVCGPNRKPNCDACPCKGFCRGYSQGMAEDLPRHLPKRSKRLEQRTVFILSCDGMYALEKRPNKGLLAGLWQFPNITGKLDAQAALAAVEDIGLKPREIKRIVEKEHVFTHIKWEMSGIYVEVKEINDRYTWCSAEQIAASVALPTAFRQFWETGEKENGT